MQSSSMQGRRRSLRKSLELDRGLQFDRNNPSRTPTMTHQYPSTTTPHGCHEYLYSNSANAVSPAYLRGLTSVGPTRTLSNESTLIRPRILETLSTQPAPTNSAYETTTNLLSEEQSYQYQQPQQSAQPPKIAHGCLLIPVFAVVWWYWTKRAAKRAVKLLLPPSATGCVAMDDDNDVENYNEFLDEEDDDDNYDVYNGFDDSKDANIGQDGKKVTSPRGLGRSRNRTGNRKRRASKQDPKNPLEDDRFSSWEEIMEQNTNDRSLRLVRWIWGRGTGGSRHRTSNRQRRHRMRMVTRRMLYRNGNSTSTNGDTTSKGGDSGSSDMVPATSPERNSRMSFLYSPSNSSVTSVMGGTVDSPSVMSSGSVQWHVIEHFDSIELQCQDPAATSTIVVSEPKNLSDMKLPMATIGRPVTAATMERAQIV